VLKHEVRWKDPSDHGGHREDVGNKMPENRDSGTRFAFPVNVSVACSPVSQDGFDLRGKVFFFTFLCIYVCFLSYVFLYLI
jgi:hypothetical protein